MQDLFNSITPQRVISPVNDTTTTALVGIGIDRQGFDGLTYIISTGTLTDTAGAFTALLEEGADTSTFTAVADADLLGTEALASFVGSDDNKCFKLGYKGNKRYTRLTITPTVNAAAAYISAVAILSHPNVAPTINPPA